MSDQSGGPGWWVASDGKWYPPDQAPPVPPPETWAAPPPGPAPRAGLSSGAIAALVVAGVLGMLLLVGALVMLTGSDNSTDEDDATSGSEDRDVAEETPAPTIPDGFELADGDGVSIAVPATWTVLEPEDVAMSEDELAAAFPDADPEVIQQESAMFVNGAVLVAFDLADADFASNINILRFPTDQGLDELGEQAAHEIESFGGEVRSNGVVQLRVGPAVRVAYDADVTQPDGSTQVARGVQHYVPIGGQTYVITFTGKADVDALADEAMATFRLG
jgi:hypothetical protein